jgi:hypothetical protein
MHLRGAWKGLRAVKVDSLGARSCFEAIVKLDPSRQSRTEESWDSKIPLPTETEPLNGIQMPPSSLIILMSKMPLMRATATPFSPMQMLLLAILLMTPPSSFQTLAPTYDDVEGNTEGHSHHSHPLIQLSVVGADGTSDRRWSIATSRSGQ